MVQVATLRLIQNITYNSLNDNPGMLEHLNSKIKKRILEDRMKINAKDKFKYALLRYFLPFLLFSDHDFDFSKLKPEKKKDLKKEIKKE